MPSVARISLTPVKGCMLLHPDAVEVGERGVVENRRFYLVDASGRRFGNLQHGWLVQIRAEYDAAAERLRMSFPNGVDVEGDALALGPPARTDFFGRSVMGCVVEGPWTTCLSAVAGQPVRLVRSEQPGDASDVRVATLVSERSLARLSEAVGQNVDGRRFRMLFTLAGCEPHEEDGWAGRTLKVGDALLRVGGPVPRCAVTQQDPVTGAHDLGTLKAIASYRGRRERKKIDFGVYADVLAPGRVRVGDRVEVLPTRLGTSPSWLRQPEMARC